MKPKPGKTAQLVAKLFGPPAKRRRKWQKRSAGRLSRPGAFKINPDLPILDQARKVMY
jgi:hypothetical protein